MILKNNKYLLENNLLGVTSYEELEEAEAFVFSLRAEELEREEFSINSFKEEVFKKIAPSSFSRYLSICW